MKVSDPFIFPLNEINWEEIISEIDFAAIKEIMISEMESLKVPSEEVSLFKDIQVVFNDEGRTSTIDLNVIKIDRFQIVRKALDYQSIDKNTPLNEIIRALTINVISHELGHQVQKITNVGLSMKHEWENDVPSERFAEGWARYVSSKYADYSEIVRKSRVLQV